MAYYSKDSKDRLMCPGNTVIVVNDQFEKAMRTFKKKVLKSGLLRELQERSYYEKPTARRKKAKAAAKKRLSRQIEADTLPKKLY